MKRTLVLLAAMAAMVVGYAGAALAAPVVNGGFETGTFKGWTVVNETEWQGTWSIYDANDLPHLPPTQGTYAALVDQNGPGTFILYQDVTLAAGATHELSFNTFYYNLADAFYTPASLSYLTDPNQQYRVDIMKPGAPVDSVAPLDVLDTVLSTKVGDPLAMEPTTMTADLSPFAGKTVRLRFALVENVAGFYGGVDNVKVRSIDYTAPTVIGLQPAATATDVSRGTNVVATFSEKMQKSTLTNLANFKLYKLTATGTNRITNVTVTPNLAGTKATLDPYGSSATPLAKNTRYKAVLTTGVKDLAANALAADKVWYFRTVS